MYVHFCADVVQIVVYCNQKRSLTVARLFPRFGVQMEDLKTEVPDLKSGEIFLIGRIELNYESVPNYAVYRQR